MTKIITISREFGSGGRELGKRLADEMGLPIYGHEIIELLAKEHTLTPSYIESLDERPILKQYSYTVGRRFVMQYPASDQQLKLITAQEQLIRRLAEHDCIVVGRAADVLLQDKDPFTIFVYADLASRINRCMERADDGENTTPEQLKRKIKKIDRQRASYHALFADTAWGRKEGYRLCVDTSRCDIRTLVGPVASYIDAWFAGR